MDAVADSPPDTAEMRAETPRLREIPYNYTSFSDREIVIRLLGAEMWTLLEELRGERRTGRSARMLFEVLGDIWVVERNPYLQDDLLDNPRRRRLLVDALRHRLDEIESAACARTQTTTRRATTEVARLLSAAQRRCRSLRALVRRRPVALRKRTLARAVAPHAPRTTSRSTASRAYRTSPTPPTGASSIRSSCCTRTPRTRCAAWSRGASSLALTIIPRGGGTGYTGGAIPLTAALGRDQHREARAALGASSAIAHSRSRRARSRRSSAARAWSPGA